VQRIRTRLLSSSFRFCLMFFVLTPWTDASYAQPESSPSEQYPGPWVEVPQEVRDLLALRKVSAARLWDVNRPAIPANIFCTARKTRDTGQAGVYSPLPTKCKGPANSSKGSRHPKGISVSDKSCVAYRRTRVSLVRERDGMAPHHLRRSGGSRVRFFAASSSR
jgi:hypothetical protein